MFLTPKLVVLVVWSYNNYENFPLIEPGGHFPNSFINICFKIQDNLRESAAVLPNTKWVIRKCYRYPISTE